MSKRVDRKLVEKKLAAFRQELKTKEFATPAELEAFTKVSQALEGMPRDVRRAVLMKLSGELAAQGKFVVSEQMDAATGKLQMRVHSSGEAIYPTKRTVSAKQEMIAPYHPTKRTVSSAISRYASGAKQVDDMIVPAMLSNAVPTALLANSAREVEVAKLRDIDETVTQAREQAVEARATARNDAKDLEKSPAAKFILDLAFAKSQAGSVRASLLSERVSQALSLKGDGSVPDESYTQLMWKKVVDSWGGKISYEGVILSKDELGKRLINNFPFFANLSGDERGLARILLIVRAECPRTGAESFERIQEAVKTAITLYREVWCHPVWNDLQQRTGSFEIETTLIARMVTALGGEGSLNLEEFVACVEALKVYHNRTKDNVCFNSYLRAMENHIKLSEAKFFDFMSLWHKSLFARLNVGHKLAAALALTDAPDMPLHSPWVAWSLTIPDGFFQDLVPHSNVIGIANSDIADIGTISLKRAWFIGTELIAILGDNSGITEGTTTSWGVHMERIFGADVVQMVRNLGMGAIAAIENHPARSSGQWGATRSKTNTKRLDAPPVGTSYELAHPVTIDLRDDLQRAIKEGRSRKGSSPKAYWIVSGHWKSQVHGPKRSLRKTIWIEPYPKGDPSLKALMRVTEVDE